MCYMATNEKNAKKKTRRDGASVVRETALADYASPTVGVRELRQNLSVYLEEVKRGRSLIVTDHGQHVAMLGPLTHTSSVLERLIREGKVTPPRIHHKDLRPAPELPGRPLSEILQEMRDEDPW